MLTMALALFALTTGSADRLTRFHGTADIVLDNGTVCTAAVRVEDLTDREYANRWHYLVQPTCDLGAFGPEIRHNHVVVIENAHRLTIEGWGTMTVWPMDPEVRAKVTEASFNGFPSGRM